MEPAKLAEYLAVLRGVGGGELALDFPDGTKLSAKLPADAPSSSPFVDAKGAPVNLDEGAPWNTREPETDTGNDLYHANFPGKPDEAQ